MLDLDSSAGPPADALTLQGKAEHAHVRAGAWCATSLVAALGLLADEKGVVLQECTHWQCWFRAESQ